jgi:cell division protein FtsL
MIKSATLLGFLLGGVMAVCVFIVKYEVQDLEAEYTELNQSIAEERQSIHVLLAEWSHLNEPARLRDLARQHLNLGAITARQMGGLSNIPRRDEPAEAYPQTSPDGLTLIQAAIQEMSDTGKTQ